MRGFFTESHTQREAPAGSVAKCGACGLFKTCETPKMKPYGKGAKRVLILGEAPGADEDEQGRPFIGKAGRVLRDVLDDLDFDMDHDALTTNAIICRPPKNATPDAKQLNFCRPNLVETIRKFKPRVVITLGHTPLKTLLTPYWPKTEALERWVGWQIPCQDHWICPTFHPSYLARMRNSLLDRRFAEHLKRAIALVEDPPPQPDWPSLIDIIYDDDEVYERLRGLDKDGSWLAFDYETNCLKPEYPKAKIFSCSVSDGTQTIAFPWKGRAIDAMGRLLRSKRTRKIASNLKMEEKWTRKEFGYGVRDWGWDTMLATHCLDNRPGICGLKFQSWVRMGVPVYDAKIEPYLKARAWYNRITHVDFEELLTYNGMDALLEWRLAMIQRTEMGYDE